MEGEEESNSSSPFFYSDYVYQWLDNALDAGISETDFWNMTIAELTRAIQSKERVKKLEAKEKATYDYILAAMVTKGVQAAMAGGEGLPDITEIYPSVFVDEIKDKQNKKQAIKDELSALRFKQFANFHNKKINKEVAKV
jgi:hypothetical protein